MAYDYLIDKAKEDAERKSLADHIRAKNGTTAKLEWPKDYEAAVDAISGAPKDPHTLLLLHGDVMTDSSKYNVPIVNNGVTISTAQSKFGGKSLRFDGNAWINFPQEYAPYKDKDFTIDWWEFCTTSDVNHQSRYFSSDAGGPYSTLGLLLGHLGKQAYCGNGWSMINGADMFNIVQNQWVHWAAVRHGNTFTTYRNGKKFAQTSIVGSIPYDTKTMHCIGGWRYSPGQKWIGYLDEFRISDIARWTADFTPPDAPYANTQDCKPEQEKTVQAVKNGPVVVTPDNGKTLSKATVNVAVPSDKKPEVAGTGTITVNGQKKFSPPIGSVFSDFTVTTNTPAPKPEEEKTITVSNNGSTSVIPSFGKTISKVIINTDVPQGPSGITAQTNDVRQGKVFGTGGLNKATGTMPEIAGGVYNANTTNPQIIKGGAYLTGDIQINDVSGTNISPENIKQGVYIRVGSGGNTLYSATGTYIGTVFAASVGHSTSGNNYGWAEAIQAVSGYWSMSAEGTGGSTLSTTATITCSKAGKYTFHYSGTSSVTSNISGFGNGKTITVAKGKTITIKAGNNREILWIEAI